MRGWRKLAPEKRVRILHFLCEGLSVGAVARLTGVHTKTVYTLLADVGCAVSEYQDRIFNDLPCKRIPVGEIWSFTYGKQPNPLAADSVPPAAGDCWTWTSLCAETKLAPTWLVGPRDGQVAMHFLADVSTRLIHRVQLRIEGHRAYLDAVKSALGGGIDYAKIVKLYGKPEAGAKRSRRPKSAHCERRIVTGYPNERHVSARMRMRRLERLTRAFSKKVRNHACAVALHFMHYNFCKLHKAHRQTPAMAAGVTDRLWKVDDILKVLEDWEERTRH